MNDADFKVHVHRMFKRTGDVDNDTSHALMGLAGESGEVIDLLKKVLYTGKPYDEETRHKLQLEIGDVLFYVYALCDVLNLSIVHILSLNKEKLEARYPNGAASVGIKETK